MSGEDVGVKLLEVLGPPAATLLSDLVRRKFASQDEAAQRLIRMAVDTGASIENLRAFLTEADAASAEEASLAARSAVYGPATGDPP